MVYDKCNSISPVYQHLIKKKLCHKISLIKNKDACAEIHRYETMTLVNKLKVNV